ncbi:uncharacterized protein LOC122856312, partial [Aphidius gifuensis]
NNEDVIDVDEQSQAVVNNNVTLSQETEEFFFTQSVKAHDSPAPVKINNDKSKLTDTISRIAETLEHKNGSLDYTHVVNFCDADVIIIVDTLSKELSLTGVDNLCKSLCDIEEAQAIYWIKTICSNLLLQKIIDLDKTSKDSRIYSTIIGKIFTKYPDAVQNLIIAPILNFDLKNTSVIEGITQFYSQQQRSNLILLISDNVKELKVWHISTLLPLLADIKIENKDKDSLLGLLVNKASEFSNDKNYSKYVLKFIKLNCPYTEEQKSLLQEIVAFNKTIFSSSIKRIISNMYFHRDLWHINN